MINPEFDTHEVTALVDRINKASTVTIAETEKVLFRGSMQIKRGAARRIRRHKHFRRVAASIDFDMFRSLRGPASEIGPNHRKRQANLAHIAENGSPTSPPIPFMRPAAEAEEPKFLKAMEDLAVKALGLE